MPAPKPPGPPPDEHALREAALRHLARYSATQAALLRVLARRVDRWARLAAPELEAVRTAHDAARAVVARLAAVGAVDDAAFAAARARSLARAGRSRRATQAHLAARGVPAAVTAALPNDPAAELAAALSYVRRRRLGAFRQPPAPDQFLPDLARLARAGFDQAVAERALRLDAAAAEALVAAARQP